VTFFQISESHVGFKKPANPDALGTLGEDVRITGIAAQTLFKSLPGDAQVDPNHRFQSKELELERIPVKNDISEEVTVLGCRREIDKPETTTCWLRTILVGD